MKVKRIVANVRADDPSEADAFYFGILGLELVMDHGWSRTYAGGSQMSVQLSAASEGGSGTAVPDLSVEVDDLDEALRRQPPPLTGAPAPITATRRPTFTRPSIASG